MDDKTVSSRVTDFCINNSVLYYVSCCLLLLGAYSMMRSPWLPGSFLVKYCEIYGIFLLYVVLLTGLCCLVLRRLSMAEDGLVIAGLVLLLVLDPTFFNNVFYTYSLGAGLAVNSFCFGLSVILCALLKAGGIPWSRTSAIQTVLVAGFVYYYPTGLNSLSLEAMRPGYFYLLSWMPLLVIVLCERITQGQSPHEAGEICDPTIIPQRLERRFRVARVLILFYVVIAHLIEASYTYSLGIHAEQLAATFLAAGFLSFKLQPNLDRKGRCFVWICALLAAWCSCAATEHSIIQLRWGVVLSPFNYGFAAIGLFLLHFWKTYRNRPWAIVAVICLALAVSGLSLSEAISNIGDLHFVPVAFLAVVFTIASMLQRHWVFPTLAGGCFMILILSLMPIRRNDAQVIFLQAWATWFGFVRWRSSPNMHPRIHSILGVFVLLLCACMSYDSAHRLGWSIDYFITAAGLLAIGKALKDHSLSNCAGIGLLAGAFYLIRKPLGSAAMAFSQIVNFGLLATVLAFLILPLAYFLSILRLRRREQRLASNQTLSDREGYPS